MKRLMNFCSITLTAFVLSYCITFSAMTIQTSMAQTNVAESAVSVSNAAVSDVVLPVVTNEQLFEQLVNSLGGLKGASTIAVAYAISQLLLFFILSPLFTSLFPKLEKDSYKLITAIGVHLIVGVLGLMVVDNLSFALAITHSTTLSAFAVLINQIYKKAVIKKISA